MATADIPADTVLFTIPRQSIICKDTSSLVAKLPGVFDRPHATTTRQQEDEDHDMDMDDDDDEVEDDDDKSQDSWTTLILILMHEHLRGAASPWKPYLDVLPASLADFSTPMFWSPEELAELQASPVAGKVGRDEAERMIRRKILPVIAAHEDLFYPAAAPAATDDPDQEGKTNVNNNRLSEDDLVRLAFRMGSVIMAYAFDLEKDDDDDDEAAARRQAETGEADDDDEDDDEWVEDREGKTMLGMVPMADILNADASFNAHIEHGDHALTATALRPIPRGTEVLNYYGPLSNGELLRRYGYVTRAHRRWNLVDLSWGAVLAALKAEVALLSDEEWEKDVLGSFSSLRVDEDEDEEAENELEEGFIIDRGAEDPDSEGRIPDSDDTTAPKKKASLPEDLLAQMKDVMKAVKKTRPDAVPDKTARDRAIYAAIAKALEARTRGYATTLAQDLRLYEEAKAKADAGVGGAVGVLDHKTMMALDVRIGEKVLLQEASEAARAKLAELAAAAAAADGRGEGRSAKRRKL